MTINVTKIAAIAALAKILTGWMWRHTDAAYELVSAISKWFAEYGGKL